MKTFYLFIMLFICFNMQANGNEQSDKTRHLNTLSKSLAKEIYSIPALQPFYLDARPYFRIDDMLITHSDSLLTKNSFDNKVNQWDSGNVYYEFDEQVSQTNRQLFVAATQEWSAIANLQFIPRTEQSNYIYVINDSRNYATVGMVGGQQILAMANWNSKYIIVHELGHSLGLWHEQQRADRDNYVEIKEENILEGQVYNFSKHETLNYSQYDFMSVMHYDLAAYSKNALRTIEPKVEYQQFINIAGQRRFISGGDQFNIATRYGAKQLNFVDDNFKQYLVSQFDLNLDGEIDSLEASNITEIHTPGEGNITDLSGIEQLRYLSLLDASNENLSSLPPLPGRIETLDISHNKFVNITSDIALPPLVANIDASYNPLDEYACDDIEFVQSVSTQMQLKINPIQSGATLTCDETARQILFSGRPRSELRSKSARNFFIEVAEGATNLTFQTSNSFSAIGGKMDIFVSYQQIPNSTNFQYASTNSDNNELVTISNPASGKWYVSLIPTASSFENVNLVASFDAPVNHFRELFKAQLVSQLSANQNQQLEFFMDVPENVTHLTFDIFDGNGDADLYVKFAEKPTLNNYDCRPWKNGNTEKCTITDVQAGRYYIKLIAYQNFAGVSLVADYQQTVPPKSNRIDYAHLSATTANWQHFTLTIGENTKQLNISLFAGSGDADLYVKRGSQPTASTYDCRPYLTGNNENCVFDNPIAGTWYLSIKAYQTYQDVNLSAEWYQ